MKVNKYADMILTNGKISTLDPNNPEVSAIAIYANKILAIGSAKEIAQFKDQKTKVIDLQNKRVIPGLNDSHLHLIRGGLNYNMELRWDGVKSLADALYMLKVQADRTPTPQWVRVVGGWSEFQFKERRMPTLAEINQVSPNTPVFILHLYDCALLNAAALRASGITKDTPDPVAGKIARDQYGNPTGMLIAEPNAFILYSTLAKGPKLPFTDQLNSTRYFMRELNRLGVTSCIDAGGGFQNYPEDYQVIEELHKNKQMTVRIAYNLFTQHPNQELADFEQWTKIIKPYSGDGFYRHNGAGEMLTFSTADFEDFLKPRPDMPAQMEQDLTAVVRLLVEQRWPFRLHATYNETIERALNVFESVNKDTKFNSPWFFDHAETATIKSLERIKKLGGGIAIQNRMAFQGEYFIDRYGKAAAQQSPLIRQMLDLEIPVGAGTDATRVSSYNPFLCLYWLTTGKTIGGTQIYDDSNILSRTQALELWTVGSANKSNESDVKGRLLPNMYADLAVLSDDYMLVPDDKIKDLVSILTVVDGKIVYTAGEFNTIDQPLPPISPDWSPVKYFGGYSQYNRPVSSQLNCTSCNVHVFNKLCVNPWGMGCGCFVY